MVVDEIEEADDELENVNGTTIMYGDDVDAADNDMIDDEFTQELRTHRGQLDDDEVELDELELYLIVILLEIDE